MAAQSLGRLLIVDDEKELMSALCEMLSDQGFETVGFNSCHDALEALKEQNFDVLLSDLMMPEMDGVTLLKTALGIDPNIIGIIMTGQGTVQTSVEAMKIGAFDYVLKPFKLNALLPVLTRAIQMRRVRMENLQLRDTVAMHDLIQAVAFTLDTETILHKVADAALQQCDADEVSIMLPSENGAELRVSVVIGEGRDYILGERMPIEQGIAGWVARHREAVTLNGQVDDPRFEPLNPRDSISSAISMPMMAGSRLMGVLNVNSTRLRRPFTLGQVKALFILANVAAPALESARLHRCVLEAEAKYRSIFDNAVEGIFVTTPAGQPITVNPRLAQILGYESREDLMSLITDFSSQVYANPYQREELLRLIAEREVVQGFECQAYRKDGSVIWVSLNERAIRDERGVCEAYEGTIEDITEHKKAEETLRESEERYRDLFENANDLIHSAAPDGSLIYVNRAWREALGYSEEEVGRLSLFEIIHPDSGPHYRKMFERALAGESLVHIEAKFVTKEGTTIMVEGGMSCQMKDGKPVATRSMFRDVTGRQRAAEALRRSEERYRDLFENANDMIYTNDLDGNFTSINKMGEVITGYSREEVVGMQMDRILLPDYMKKVRERLTGEAAGGLDKTIYEVEIACKDGRMLPLEVNTRLIYEEGEPVGVQDIARDISERKSLEEQLRQAQKMEAIGRLAGGVAHDFNNLLTAILGYSQMALNRLHLDNPLRKEIEEIEKAGKRAASLTSQLLAFSRKQVLQPKVLNLNIVVTEVEKMLRRLIGEDIQLDIILDSELGRVKADYGQLEQIILNLAVNARDAMPRGGTLTIETANVNLDESYTRTRAGVESGPYVVLSISDTGTGMEKEIQAHIFEPFFSTKEAGKGTGLGLSTVYGIVKQSSGDIKVNSQVGCGTTFRIYLPRIESDSSANEAHTPLRKLAGGTETILLVEDEEGVRKLARTALEMNGYTVLDACNADDAMERFHLHKDAIDMIVTDVVMPGISGRELSAQIEAAGHKIKVLYISGYTDDAILHHGVLDADIPFLQKPFTLDALACKVRDVLDASPLLGSPI